MTRAVASLRAAQLAADGTPRPRGYGVRAHELRRVPAQREPLEFLDALDPAQAAVLTELGVRRAHLAGTTLYREREVGDHVVLALSGLVKLTVASGSRCVLVGIRGGGALLSDISVIDGAPQAHTATAVGAGETLRVPRQEFVRFLELDGRAAVRLAVTEARRASAAERRRAEAAAASTLQRVARQVAELAGRFGRPHAGALHIELDLTQAELAGWIGASPKATSVALRTLRDLGLLTIGRRQIVVHDPDGLRRVAR